MGRRKMVAANWKMNLDYTQAEKLCKAIKKQLPKVKSSAEVVLFSNAVFLHEAAQLFKTSKRVSAGAQNVYFENSGAYTGEISAEMIVSAGAKYVLCGHSERRSIFGETDEMVAKKLAASLQNGLSVILCVGENLDCRKRNKQNEWVAEQLRIALGGLSKKYIDRLIIAYEPVWAIGTGVNATSAQAQEMHAFIRAELKLILGSKGTGISILYGGSCNPTNANELFSCKDVDGGLIGGASLNAESFLQIVAAAK